MKAAAGALALIALSGAGCVHQVVGVAPSEIFNHLPELRRQGHAIVGTTPDGTYKLTVDKVVKPEFSGRALFGLLPATEWRAMTVRDLIANCPDSPCLLQRTSSEALAVGSRLRPNWDVLKVLGGATLAMLVIAIPVGFLVDHYTSPMTGR